MDVSEVEDEIRQHINRDMSVLNQEQYDALIDYIDSRIETRISAHNGRDAMIEIVAEGKAEKRLRKLILRRSDGKR